MPSDRQPTLDPAIRELADAVEGVEERLNGAASMSTEDLAEMPREQRVAILTAWVEAIERTLDEPQYGVETDHPVRRHGFD